MVDWKVPLYKIHWDEEDVDAVSRVIRRGMYWTGGQSVPNFEDAVSDYVNIDYGIAFNSGTSGLYAVLEAWGISEGDEVIVPSFTFAATCNSVVNLGAKPVFAEIEGESFGLDPSDVKERITPNTRAIIPVHYGGGACQIRALREIADDMDILLIEDAAESLGSRIGEKKVGSLGEASMFSFCGNKVMTTGEGGMVVTNDERAAKKMRLIRSHGRVDKGDYFSSGKSFDYVLAGHNWRMSDITAELGLSQFSKLDTLIEKRRNIAQVYDSELQGLPLRIPRALEDVHHIYQMYTVLFENKTLRNKARKHLEKAGIMTKIYFDCVHLTTFYRDLMGIDKGYLPTTESLSDKVLTIPIFPTMNEEQISYVTDELRQVITL